MSKENIESAKSEIIRLIDAYENLKKSGGLGSFNEDETCRKFILPLFHALGWDTEGKKIIDEVTGQKIAGGQKRVDYSFNVSGQPIMFLEAKQLSADLDDPQYARQAVNYGYSKTVKWVVLSDFEGIIVFNTLLKLKRERISERTVLKLKYTEYLDRIDDLWLLSKESFFEDKLNKHAQSIGHVTNKIPINELLLSKLLVWRNELIKNIARDNDGLSKEDVAECVQRLLNRLIFIRTCEDREIDQRNLLRNLNKEWQSGDKRLDKMLQEVFRNFDEGYDSSLFEKHLVDTIKINSDLLFDVIGGLYEDFKEDVEFDFAVIDADILGSIYEQYLGTIQKGEGAKDKEKRKSHGIYYTPKYIVDYIVKNTLGKILEEAIKDKDYAKIGKLKVLDPACGSGSFLLKALEMFDDAYGKTPDFAKYPKGRKIKTLCNNIYGVDLDSEAVELTRLNLLLSSTYSRKKLPNLSNNIECGNSLIDDPKVAGDKAFDWNKRFKEVMDKGGFDVIIGNPPYVNNRNLNDKDKEYFESKYTTAYQQYDIYVLFYELALKLLNPGGYLAFIAPNKFAITNYGIPLRKLMLQYKIINVVDVSQIGVFSEASTYPYIVIIQKISTGKNTIRIDLPAPNNFNEMQSVSMAQDSLDGENPFLFNANKKEVRILTKIKGKAIIDIYRAKPTTKDISDKGAAYAITNKEIGRYYIQSTENRINPNEEWEIDTPAILMKKVCYTPTASILTLKRLIPVNTVYVLHSKDKTVPLQYLLCILNSKLIGYYARKKYGITAMQGGFIELRTFEIESIPIKIEAKLVKPFFRLANKMLDFNQLYAKIKDKHTTETDRLKRQIEETDQEIDELVYKVYGLTEEEIRVVEGRSNDK